MMVLLLLLLLPMLLGCMPGIGLPPHLPYRSSTAVDCALLQAYLSGTMSVLD